MGDCSIIDLAENLLIRKSSPNEKVRFKAFHKRDGLVYKIEHSFVMSGYDSNINILSIEFFFSGTYG